MRKRRHKYGLPPDRHGPGLFQRRRRRRSDNEVRCAEERTVHRHESVDKQRGRGKGCAEHRRVAAQVADGLRRPAAHPPALRRRIRLVAGHGKGLQGRQGEGDRRVQLPERAVRRLRHAHRREADGEPAAVQRGDAAERDTTLSRRVRHEDDGMGTARRARLRRRFGQRNAETNRREVWQDSPTDRPALADSARNSGNTEEHAQGKDAAEHRHLRLQPYRRRHGGDSQAEFARRRDGRLQRP